MVIKTQRGQTDNTVAKRKTRQTMIYKTQYCKIKIEPEKTALLKHGVIACAPEG
jgi:hypothetical protein